MSKNWDTFVCSITPGETLTLCGLTGQVVQWQETLLNNEKMLLRVVLDTSEGYLGITSERNIDRNLGSIKTQYTNPVSDMYLTRYDACTGTYPIKRVDFSF